MTALRRNVLNMVELIPEESLFPVYSYISDILKEKAGKDEAYETPLSITKEKESEEYRKEEISEEEKLAKSRAAFQELLKIRDEISKMNLGSIEQIREEAITEKYGKI